MPGRRIDTLALDDPDGFRNRSNGINNLA